MNFAADKLSEIRHAFFRLDEQFRANAAGVSSKDIQALLIDLAAVIPALSGAELGMAKVIQAAVLYYEFLMHTPILYDGGKSWRLPSEALKSARSGRTLLARHKPKLMTWANSVVRQLEIFEKPEKAKFRRQRKRAK